MELERQDVHDIRNQLSISIGMLDLIQKSLTRDGREVDLSKLSDRIEKSILAQKKLLQFFEGNKSTKEP